jgi:predicted nucleotidyltransferase
MGARSAGGAPDVKTIADLPTLEQRIVQELKGRVALQFPGWPCRMMVFGSRARGDAAPDSDLDLLLEIETEHVDFPEKQRIRRLAGELSMEFGIVVSLLVTDRRLRHERGDFSIFESIREEGIPV